MTKGKYAARAANRLAALDNTLLRDKSAEVDRLTTRVAELDGQLAAERRDRDAIVLDRAQALSAEEIAAAYTEIRELKAAQQQLNHRTAEWIARYIHELLARVGPDEDIFPSVYGNLDYEKILHHLVGQDLGKYVAIIFGDHDPKFATRAYRRMRSDDGPASREMLGYTERDRKRELLRGMRHKANVEEA
jgi:hypothetical protein